MRGQIACMTCSLKGKCNDQNPIVGKTPVDKGRPRMDICNEQLKEADQILSVFREGIEKLKIIEISELFPIIGKQTDKFETLLAQAQLDDIKRQLKEVMK